MRKKKIEGVITCVLTHTVLDRMEMMTTTTISSSRGVAVATTGPSSEMEKYSGFPSRNFFLYLKSHLHKIEKYL